MSVENVELLRAYGRASVDGLEAILPFYAPDIVWHLDASHPDQRILRGKQEVAEYFRGWYASFDDMRSEPGQFIDRGEYVVVPFVAYARPRGSSAEVRLAETWAFRVRDGVIVEVHEYLDTDDALAAIPVEGQPDPL